VAAPLPLFFVIAFAWTWAWQAPIVLGYEGPLWPLLLGVGGIGPSLAAIAVTRGRVLRELLARTRWWWYAVAVAVPIAVKLVGLWADVSLGASMPAAIFAVPALGVMLLPAFGEELGWRGFAYPRLADATSPAIAAVVTGFVWGLWHLPTALFPGAELGHFPIYLAMVTVGGIWMAWLYESSGRCVMTAILAHAAINAGLVAHAGGPGKLVAWGVIGAVALAALYGRERRAHNGASAAR